MTRRPTLRTAASQAQAEKILRLLDEQPRTIHDLAAELGVHVTTVQNYLWVMHGVSARIVRWVKRIHGRERHYPTAIWGCGAGRDAPKPKPKPAAQVIHDYYVRSRQDPDRYPKAEIRRKRRSALGHNESLVRKLSAQPAANPIEAMVKAALVARRGS